jgi:precorrin-6B methylase 2
MISPRLYARSLRLVSGLRSLAGIRRLHGGESHAGQPVELHFRALGDAPIRLRPGTLDLQKAHRVFVKEHHLPPPELDPASVRTIWDLGASVGLTSAHLAARYPEARVIAVEADPGTAELCRFNVGAFAARCEVIEAAVGTAADEAERRAISLHSLAERTGDGQVVDYVRMNVGGAESGLLRERAAWVERVRALKVEVHLPYTREQCAEDLQRLGFATSSDPGAPRVVAAVRTRPPRVSA